MTRNIVFHCAHCGAQFFRASAKGRPSRYCPKCAPQVARERTAERQRRFRKNHDFKQREARIRRRILESIARLRR